MSFAADVVGVGEAGGGEDDVEPAETIDGGLGEGFAGVFLRGVGFLVEGAAPQRFDGTDGFGGALCVDVGDGDVGAFFGEADGGGFAEAAGGAGNDGDLVFESVGDGHAFPFDGAARVCRRTLRTQSSHRNLAGRRMSSPGLDGDLGVRSTGAG